MTTDTGWMNSEQARHYLGLSTIAAVRERVRRGQIRAHRFGRELRFRREDLDAAITAIDQQRETGR